MKTEFMTLWDGFDTDDNAQVMVHDNRSWDVDGDFETPTTCI